MDYITWLFLLWYCHYCIYIYTCARFAISMVTILARAFVTAPCVLTHRVCRAVIVSKGTFVDIYKQLRYNHYHHHHQNHHNYHQLHHHNHHCDHHHHHYNENLSSCHHHITILITNITIIVTTISHHHHNHHHIMTITTTIMYTNSLHP